MPRLGVLGTIVWDTIHGAEDGRDPPVEEWGGIAYALAAAASALPAGWTIFPILKVGRDARAGADSFLQTLAGVDSLDGVLSVPEENNRVELFYHTAGRRCEKLTGGVPGWKGEEIASLASTCDALYVNFVSGWELDLDAARSLRGVVSGPLYCDIHSLMLGVGSDGMRRLRPLEDWRSWLGAFDVVQVNEDELNTLADGRDDPWTLADEAVGSGTSALLVTQGERGARWVATQQFGEDGVSALTVASAASGDGATEGALRRGRVDADSVVSDADPTGCGDVWGATCFARLLAGESLEGSMRDANRAAARNAAHRGATGLSDHLAGHPGLLVGGGD